MQKKNFWICSILIFLLCAQLSAHSGMFWGEKKLRVAKTQWFDIIYPKRCEQSAAILYEKADTVYEEVAGQYGLEPSFRMPVVITPTVESFNAFWAAIPYNHIAIYDTSVSGSSELAVFSETLLSTFRHELTHAVTYNMKNGFWRGVGKVLGDCVAPGMVSVTTGMAEGATVTSESAGGEGRLNDEYAKHYVKQAKIEGVFPSYHDVSGAADNSPGGAPYFFNGAFHYWLQDKYGMEPYAEFWYRVVNGKNLTVSGAFKKSFGIKLKEAWKQFVQDYEVPQLEANPVKAGTAFDFFEPELSDYSNLNNAGSLYSSLTSAGGKLVWLDKFGWRVFDENGYLFAQRGITGVRLSNDGRFLALSYITDNAAGDKARVRLYDFETKRFFSIKDKGLKDAVVLNDGCGGLYLVAQKYIAQQFSIIVYRLLTDAEGRRITATEPYTEIILGSETNPYEFTDLGNGSFAFLKKTQQNYSLCIMTADGTVLKEYGFPQGMAVRSLSFDGNNSDGGSFYFSYAQKGTLPRLGKLEAGQLFLSTQDISGGVFEPVVWNNQIVYIGEFLRQNRILCLKDDSFLDGTPLETVVTVNNKMSAPSELPATSENSIPSKTYNPFPYFTHGIFMPLSTYQSQYFGTKAAYASHMYDFMIGATYITSNPWSNGTADLITLTGGYNPFSNAFGTSLTINKGTATPLFNSETALKSEFTSEGWQHGGIVSAISSSIETGRVSTIIITNNATLLFNSKKQFSVSDTFKIQFSTIRKAGPGRFERTGFSVAAGVGRRYDAPLSAPADKVLDLSAVSVALKVCIPHILPFESKYGYTYNLPLTFGFTLLPTSSIYGYVDTKQNRSQPEGLPPVTIGNPVFDAAVELTAFSMDIQKAIPGITAVYLNDFYINCGYAATGTAGTASKDGFQTSRLPDYFKAIGDGRGFYLDSVYLKTGLEFTPNIGLLASSNYKMAIYAIYGVTLHFYKEIKPLERLTLSLGLNMNF